MNLFNFGEKLYPCLPIAVQNVLITLQGFDFRRQRYSRVFSEALSAAKERATWSADRLGTWQLEQLRNFLCHAGATSAFWQRRFSQADFDPASLRDLGNLRQLPVLEKSDLRDSSDICSSAVPPRRLIWVHTSGTTGTPLRVAFTPDDICHRVAFLHRMFGLFGVPPLARSIRLSGRTLFPGAARDRVYWRMNYAMSQMLMSSYDLHPDNLQLYIDQMARFRPIVIDGYPSSIFVLARYIRSSGQDGRITPRLVMTTAETLEDHQREEISLAFGGCTVLNQYASSEGAPFITQDTFGELVVNVDSGVFEFVRPGTDTPAAPGEVAEMLLTSFTTHAFPLIRYRIGDTVLLHGAKRLSRDWDMPVVKRVLGRQEDILYTTARGYIPSLNKVFAKAPSSILEAQIVQETLTDFVLKVVPKPCSAFHLSDVEGAICELRARVGDVNVRVEVVDELARGPNGKLRAVIGLPEIPQ